MMLKSVGDSWRLLMGAYQFGGLALADGIVSSVEKKLPEFVTG